MIQPVPNPTKSYWLTKLPPNLQKLRNYGALANLPTTEIMDVVIIGSGMTGASVAYHLVRSKNKNDNTQKICVLEGRELCSGATGRNGGFLHAHSFNQWWPLYEKYGFMTATKLCLLEKSGRKAIHNVSEKENFDCDIDYNVKLAMLFPNNQGLKDKLGWFHLLRHNVLSMCGIQALDTAEDCSNVMNIKKSTSNSNNISSAIVIDSGCDTFYPAKFVYNIFQKLINETNQIRVHTHTMVKSVTEVTGKVGSSSSGDSSGSYKNVVNDETLYLVKTNRGDILSRNVVHATNGWIGGLLPNFRGIIQPVLNTVVSIENPPSSLLIDPNRRTGMDLQPGYHYWHSRMDGTIILGGFRNNRKDRGVGVWKDDHVDVKDIQVAERLLHGLGFFKNENKENNEKVNIDLAWTGIIGWSMDGLPFVGPWYRDDKREESGEYVCAGFSGHGMTQTWLAGQVIAEMIMERSSTSNYQCLLPTKERIENARKKGGDWLAYEKSKEE